MRYLILLAALAFCIGCKGDAVKAFERVVQETHHLEPNGTMRIINVDGSIRFYGWPYPEVQIRATTRAYSVERLHGIEMRVSSRPDSLSIDTIFPSRKKWSLRDRSGVIDYVIVMPENLRKIESQLVNGEISIDGLRGGNAHAFVENGRLSAKNCFSNIDFEARNGAIDFYYTWWEPGAYLGRAAIPNGGIGLFLPRDASFHLEAETQGGSVLCNLIDADEHPKADRKKLRRSFGSETGPTFQLKAGNGNVLVRGY